LSNSGEFIAIKNSSLHIIDSVNYSSSWGANDNGKSLELKNGIWIESYVDGGTPCMPNDDKPIESQTTKKEATTGLATLNNATNVSTNKATNNTLNASLNLSSKQNTALTENETSKNRTKIERNINKTKESAPNKGLQTGLFGLTISNYVLALILLASIILGVSSMILLRAFKSKQKEMSKKVKSSKN
jgi:hypothetical protein